MIETELKAEDINNNILNTVTDKSTQTLTSLKTDTNRDLKIGIWIYFLLLIFEGALRKWFLPGLATPLLIIRDPIAIWLVLKCWQRNLLPSSIYLVGMLLIGVISIFTAVFLGHGNLLVALFGARILLFHFPIIFVIGEVFNRDDVIKIGKATLWITIPMTILIGMQFYSPQSAWVNRGVGGDMAGAGYSGANGYFRPPATFSFTTGTAAYYGFAACFVFYFWFDSKRTNILLITGSTLAMLAAIPFSISRTIFFQILATAFFTVLAVSRKPKYFSKLILAIIGGVLIFSILSQLSFFNIAIDAFTTRLTDASNNEGGLKGTFGSRFLTGLSLAFTQAAEKPYFGYGIGMGTNVGSMLLSGTKTFLIAEDEWSRLTGELGALLGLFVIFIRIGLTLKISIASYKRLAKDDFLPWLLLSYGFLTLSQGGWAQPTYLGFSVLIGGLMLASLNTSNNKNTVSLK